MLYLRKLKSYIVGNQNLYILISIDDNKQNLLVFVKKATIIKMKVSNIQDHNSDIVTDKLYEPLRKAIENPESTTIHYFNTPSAAEKSLIHDRYQQLTPAQIAKLKKELFIPIDQQLVPTQHMEKIQNHKFRVIDAKERVLGSPMRKQQMESIVKNKRNSQIVYEVGDKVQTATNVSQLLQYSKSNPNLRSQILTGVDSKKSFTPIDSESPTLNKQFSENHLPTYEQISKWMSFKERQNIRQMRELQVNKEAKGHLYEYNLTATGTQVKIKLRRQNSTGSLKGSTITEPIPLPGSVKQNYEQQPLIRQKQGAVPLPISRQLHTTSSLKNLLIQKTEGIRFAQSPRKPALSHYVEHSPQQHCSPQQQQVHFSTRANEQPRLIHPYYPSKHFAQRVQTMSTEQKLSPRVHQKIMNHQELTQNRQNRESEYTYQVKPQEKESKWGCGFCGMGKQKQEKKE